MADTNTTNLKSRQGLHPSSDPNVFIVTCVLVEYKYAQKSSLSIANFLVFLVSLHVLNKMSMSVL